MNKLLDVLNHLKTLPKEFRSTPFWAWNDKLEHDELIRQIRGMEKQGIGGFFIHSREGLETEYLSDEWMNCVESSIIEAQSSGLEAWIYDEDKWPSGSAGGMVSLENPGEFTAKAVTAELLEFSYINSESILSELRMDKSILGIYKLNFNREQPNFIESFTFVESEDYLLDINIPIFILICRMERSGTSEWYNGLAPSDNLNPETVKCFLNLTHEKYKSRFSRGFGKSIKGFFTDEPNFCDFFSHFTPGRPWLPWSTVLEDYFIKQRGYSLLDILPLLFFHGSGEEKARYDYWLTLTELFVCSYTRQIYQWCDNNNLLLTGHMLYENDLGYSVRVGGSSMPHYRYMHVPGIDILGDQREEYLTVKQCTSVANQFGRDTVLTETYGCTGWDFSFAGQKRVGDWQFVMGVNKRCQHLSLYSLSGCRKRDYPPSFNYHTSWWSHNHILEDYFARLAICVTMGEVEREILFLHPVGTIWMKSGSTMEEDLENRQMNMGWLDNHIMDLNKEGDQYNKLSESLLKSQFDFDFGDELIMKNDGSVINSTLKVGMKTYNFVIVPSLDTIMNSTVDLLEEFLIAGGTIFWVKPFPRAIDAVKSDRIQLLTEHHRVIIATNYAELLTILAGKVNRPFRICDEFGKDYHGFLSMVRKLSDGKMITVVNTSKSESKSVVIYISGFGSITSYDPLSDSYIKEKITLLQRESKEIMVLRTKFNPGETRVLIINNNVIPDKIEPLRNYSHPHEVDQLVMSFSPKTSISLSMENALVLDRCCYSISQEDWSLESEVWQCQKSIRDKLSMRQVYYNGAPQRYLWVNNREDKNPIVVALKFYFYIDLIPAGPVFVVVEKSENFRIECNNVKCSITDNYYLDKTMRKHKISSLNVGENMVEFNVDYLESIELENIFIVGDFGVSQERSIIKKPDSIQRGDWCFQGLYHYPGNVCYEYDLPKLNEKWLKKLLFLNIGAFEGTLAVVKINDSPNIYVLQGFCSIPVNGLFKTDSINKVEIEIVGSLRNLMGPFHQSSSVCSRISWEDFRTEGVAFTPEYSVKASGIMGEVSVVAR